MWFKRKKHTDSGLETPDQTPIEVTLRTRPLTIHEQIARFCKDEALNNSLKNNGFDSFDEADDFYIPESEEFVSPYERQVPTVQMIDEEPIDSTHYVQTRMDEINHGKVGMMENERLNRVAERLKPIAKAPLAPAQPPKAEPPAKGA